MLTKILLTSVAHNFWYYPLIFFLSMVEGPMTTMIGAVLSSIGLLSLFPVFLAVVLGNLTADLGWYWLGRFGKLHWFSRFFEDHPKVNLKIDQMRIEIQQQAPKLLFLAKFTSGLPIPTLLATGIGKVPVRKWIGGLILGELIKTAALIGAGTLFSHALDQTWSIFNIVFWSLSALMVLIGVFWIAKKKKNQIILDSKE